MAAIEIRSDEITPYLERLRQDEVGRFLGRALLRVAEAAAEGSRAAAGPFPHSKTGNLFASIGWRKMEDSSVIGFVAGPMRGKGAKGYHRNMVEGGTKAHRIRFPWEKKAGVPENAGSILHPGATPNPWMTRGRPGIIARAVEAFDKAVKEELT